MTLSTPAEYRRAEEIGMVCDEVDWDVHPEAVAEEYVMEIEGTEANPTVVDDPRWRARQVADDVQADAEDAAGCYTESRSLAESVGMEFADRAYDAVLEGLRGAPTVEVRE